MRRITAGMAAAAVLCTGSAAQAQSPSPEPPPWFGGRVELPEHGFAVTVPDGAVAYDMTGDLERQLRVVVPDASDGDIAGWSSMMRERMRGQLVLAIEDSSSCGFVVGPTIGADLASEVDGFYERQAADGNVVHLETPRVVELPAADALVVSHGRAGEEATFYLGEKDGMVFDIWCAGAERPEDDWLSIAASFEWLPVPVKRAETPRGAASIEVPAAWEVMVDADFLPDAGPWSRSELHVTDWLMAREAQSGEGCSLIVYEPQPGGRVGLDAEVAGLLADYRSGSGVDILSATPEPVSLAAGEALRVRVVSDEGRPPDGETHTEAYVIARDGVLAKVGCSGSVPHPELWQSIAETLEFRPPET